VDERLVDHAAEEEPRRAELLRAKAPRVVGHLGALHGVLHGLPLTYNKDLQEDKEHLFDAVDTLALCLAAAAGMVAGARFDRERMAAAAADELIAATDLADLLVTRGTPFREAHGVVAGLVREALERGVPLRRRRRVRASDPRGARTCLRALLVARVEGERGRHRARRGAASSSTAPRGSCSG
jgi:argininosuccinate lyase